MKSNKSISRKKFFDQNPFFAISEMAKNELIFELGKSLKLPNMQIQEEFFLKLHFWQF